MRILYIGTGEIGVPTLSALLEADFVEVVGVVTQPDRPVGRKQELMPPPIKAFIKGSDIALFQPEKINRPEVLDSLQRLEPDLAIVCAYGQILKLGVLKLPKLGCLNIHASLLPKYRGAACIQAAIRDGESRTGVTIMWMDEGLDTGDILLKEEVAIEPNETAGMLHDRLAALAPGGLMQALRLIEKGEAPRIKQNDAEASYVGRLKKEDGEVDWNQTAGALDCHVRAMTPWPSAFTWVKGFAEGSRKMLKLHQVKYSGLSGDPGVVVEVMNDYVRVGAGKGSVEIYEMQLEGKKRMSCEAFLRGYDLSTGTQLG